MAKKKVLFVIWSGDKGERSPYDPWFVAGGELAARWKAEGLAKLGWETHFFSISGIERDETINGVSVYQAKIPSHFSRMDDDAKSMLFKERLSGHIQRVKPNIIYSRGVTKTSVDTVPVARQKKVPVVVAMDDRNFIDAIDDGTIGEKLSGITHAFINANGITVQHERLKSLLLSRFKITCPVKTILPGIRLERFEKTEGTFDHLANGGKIKILFLSRLAGSKRQDICIDAMPGILEKIPNVQLIIAGEGEYRKSLEEKTAALGLARNVSFIGKVDNTDVPSLLRVADVGMLLSRREGFPTVLLEYFAAGKPVIVSDIIPCNYVVRNLENGVLVKNEPDIVTENTVTLLCSEQLVKIGKRNREIARQYDIVNSCRSLDSFLGKLI